MVHCEDLICDIFEEIIEFNTETNRIISLVTIMERSQVTLLDKVDEWLKPKQLSFDLFSKEKIAFICLKTMEIVSYLHKKCVYLG